MEQKTLKEFIEENRNLLATLAVFAAISGLVTQLSIEWLKTGLSFIALFGTVLIWHETLSQMPKGDSISGKLFLFRYVILFGLGLFVFYWLLNFRQIWHYVLPIPLFLLFVFGVNSAVRDFFEFRYIKIIINKFIPPGVSKIIKTVYKVVLFIISGVYAIILSFPLNIILDQINKLSH